MGNTVCLLSFIDTKKSWSLRIEPWGAHYVAMLFGLCSIMHIIIIYIIEVTFA